MPFIDKEELRTEFKQFFNLDAYDYQLEVAQYLLNGESVVLQAPTGAGKTNTALFPYLYARKHLLAGQFPRKLIYSVERRILVNNFHSEVNEILKESGLNERLAGDNNNSLNATILTGERPEDPTLQGDMVFTTIDQTLSSFLLIPYSLSFRVANLNAGAIAAAYLVFDEAHLFDPKTAFPTLMWILQKIQGITPTLLMTATFSKPILEKLASLTNGKIVTVSQDELKEIPAQATKKRYFQTVAKELTESAEFILEKYNQSERKRSIVVCNTVDRAQKIYDKLLMHTAGTDTRLILLHSRFLQTDRKAKEADLLRLFGRPGPSSTDSSGSVILIATQVIEVGVDITSENLHTDLAPANTILQRAGRCARYAKEEGTVYVYAVENELPYSESKTLFEPTFEKIASFNGQPVNFEMEQSLIEAVHNEADQASLKRIEINSRIHGDRIKETLTSLNRSWRSELIRDADSISVLVHSKPEEIEDPYSYETFSMFDGSFRGKLGQLQTQAEELRTWAARQPILKSSDETVKQELERVPARYEWPEIKKGDDLRGLSIVVVNPRLVCYDKERGFRFELNDGVLFQSPSVEQTIKQFTRSSYQLETYAEHIRNVNAAYSYFKFEDEIAFASARLQEKLGSGVPAELVDRSIRFSFVFHDAGKLTEGWQTTVHNWQRFKNPPVANPQIMLAHTDFNWQQDREMERKFKRPPHAVEGAMIVKKFLKQELGNYYRPVLTAIARHHSPDAQEMAAYKLHSGAVAALNEALKTIESGHAWTITPDQVTRDRISGSLPPADFLNVDQTKELLLFFLVVRVLRLADQSSFQYAKLHQQIQSP